MKDLKIKCCVSCGSMLVGDKCKVPGCSKNKKSNIRKREWKIKNVNIKTKNAITYNEAKELMSFAFEQLSKTKKYVEFEILVSKDFKN